MTTLRVSTADFIAEPHIYARLQRRIVKEILRLRLEARP